jgi:flagellar motor switch/type III secretory pathway protein FliN
MTGTELATRSPETMMQNGPELAVMAPTTSWMMRIEEHPSWGILSMLRVSLRATVALNRFCVRDLLTLREGQVLESASPGKEDVMICAGEVQLGWSEFEVLEQRMAVRLTRLG